MPTIVAAAALRLEGDLVACETTLKYVRLSSLTRAQFRLSHY